MRFSIIAFLFIVIGVSAFAAQKEKKDNFYTFFYQSDPDRQLNISDFSRVNPEKLQHTEEINLGFNSPAIWIRINLDADLKNEMLMIQNAHLDTIDVYFYANNTLQQHIQSGDHLNFDTRYYNHDVFNFNIPDGTTTVFIKAQTEGSMAVPISIFSMKDYIETIRSYEIFIWMYLGFIILIAISSLFLFAWLNESIYIFYAINILSIGFFTGIDHGLTFQYLWPNHPEMNQYNAIFYLSILFPVIFTDQLLNLKKNVPFLYKIQLVAYTFIALATLSAVLLPYRTFISIFSWILFVLMIWTLYVSIHCYFKNKNSTTKFFMIGWICFCSSWILYQLLLSGIIPYNITTGNFIQIGSCLEIFFFNIAILSQIKYLKTENQEMLVKHNQELEIKVQERTVELAEKTEEVSAQNKMLEEQQEELLLQSSAMEEQSRLVEEKNRLLQHHQVYLEEEVAERTKKLSEAYRELQMNEERYRKLVEFSPEAIIVYDYTNRKIMDVNENACKLFKRTREQMLVLTAAELSPPAQPNGTIFTREDRLEKANRAERGEYVSFEWYYMNSLGESIPCQVWYSRLPDKELTLIRVSMVDISENVRNRQKLEEEQNRLRTVLGNIPVIVWATDEEGQLNFCDGNLEEMLNIRPEDLYQKKIENIFAETPENKQLVSDLIDHKKEFQLQIQKSKRFFDLRANPLLNENNKFTGYIGVFYDITERIKSEERIKDFIEYQTQLINKIKQQEAGLSALINSTQDVILSVDTGYNLLEFNKFFAETTKNQFGILPERGKNIFRFTPLEMIDQADAHLKRALKGEVFNITLTRGSQEDGFRYYSTTYSPIISESNEITGVSIISREITDIKKAEKDLMDVQQQIADYKLMALRSVMNPHFLFNSLNSIQYFIAKSERKLALDYLSIFSILIRKILDSSINTTIALNTELEILKYYIELEQLRFENKFDFQINIDPNIETDYIEIPSLLIQPYVENAILHGITKNDKKGKLHIKLLQENDHLIFIVEDDGIGRKKAAELKEKSSIKAKSYGMLVTQERLEIINKTRKVSVIIEDLTDKKGEGNGTRVKIYIPI